MNAKTFSEALSELNSKYIEEAINYKKKAIKPIWAKWGAAAACFAAIAILGASLFYSGLFGRHTDVVTLDNGDKIVFVESDAVHSSQLDIDVVPRQLTEEETHSLFADLPVTANAIYTNSNPQRLIGFEGMIGTIKMIVSTSEIQLFDTVIAGENESTEINGTNIAAGYFVTDPNSKGEQNAIYYASFELGSSKIYLENSGPAKNSKTTKNQLAEAIQKLIENGELELGTVKK